MPDGFLLTTANLKDRDDDPFVGPQNLDVLKPLPAPGAGYKCDERTFAWTSEDSVDEAIVGMRGHLRSALATIHNADDNVMRADRFVLRAGSCFRELVLAHPDVAKAPYGKVAFNAAANTFTLLGDVEVVEDPILSAIEARLVPVVDGKERDCGFQLLAVDPSLRFEAEPETREADTAATMAIHTRDWSGVRGKDIR